jgi:hypothetical protein
MINGAFQTLRLAMDVEISKNGVESWSPYPGSTRLRDSLADLANFRTIMGHT